MGFAVQNVGTTGGGGSGPDNNQTISGTLANVNDTVVLQFKSGGMAGIVITGTWDGLIQFNLSVDGTNYNSITVYNNDHSTNATATTTNGTWVTSIGGSAYLQIIATSWTSGTANILIIANQTANTIHCISNSPNTFQVGVTQAAGPFTDNVTEWNGNAISTGDGTVDAGTLRVTQANNVPVNSKQSGVWSTGRTWTLASGSDSVSAIQGTSPWVVSGTIAATQSGTWTVQQGTPPWSVSQSGSWTTGRTWTLSSGSDSVSCVQSTSPWVVSGTVTANQGGAPWSVSQSGTWNIGTVSTITNPVTVTQSTAANLNATVVGTGTFAVQAAQSGNWTVGLTVLASAANSSTTPLGSGATFTGTYVDVSSYQAIMVSVFSDKSSAANGVILEFSSDGVNVDITQTFTFDSTHANGDMYTLPTPTQFFRVRYTNGGTAQTTFRLETSFSTAPETVPTALLNTTLTDSSMVALTRSIIAGQTTGGGGGYVNVKVTPSGSLTVAIGDISGIVGQQAMANSIPVVLASNQSSIPVTQSGTWTVQQGSAPWSVSQSGTWTTGRTWTLASGTDSISAVQSGTWTVQQGGAPWSVSQSGTWNIGTVTTVTTVSTLTSITNDVNTKRKPDATSTYSPTNVDSTALEASHVIKNGSGVLYQLDVYNSDTVPYYILLFNSTTVPADTTAPTIAPIKIGADSNVSLNMGEYGRFFSTGIAVCGSTTAATKTVAGAKFWFSARYS